MTKTPIAVARGDGIGPEIMEAVLGIMEAAGAELDITEITVGNKAYAAGHKDGIPAEAWDVMKRSKAFLKAPLTTPQGEGYSSVNVAIRKRLDLFASVRPCQSYAPFVKSVGEEVADLVIVRENIEDLYAGIEHRLTPDTTVARKVYTRSEIERIVRYAFDYARAEGRKKVTCMTKDNIQKMTDGLFHKVFDEIGAEYPDIKKEFYIVDIGTGRMASRIGGFDVVVTPNLYGDIISDVAAEVTGSVGLAGSANIGESFGMFEAVHGTAPDIAGRGIANPSGLLMGAVMMLNYIGQHAAAEKIHNALLVTLEDGIHTGEIYRPGVSVKKANTAEFAAALTARLGQVPKILKAVNYTQGAGPAAVAAARPAREKPDDMLAGMDVHVAWEGAPADLAEKAKHYLPGGTELKEILTARGDSVWPKERPYFRTDAMTLRILFTEADKADELEKRRMASAVLSAFSGAAAGGIDWREVRQLTVDRKTLERNYR